MLTGVFPIVPAIFAADGRIDATGMQRVVDYIVEAGAAGVVFPGLASEYDCLTRDERLELTAAIGDRVRNRIPLIVGASATTATEAIEYAVAGAAAGAEVAMVLTPHALAGDLSGLVAFYREIEAASGIAVMLQNAPPPMGVGLALEAVAEIAANVPGVRFVKEEAMPSGQRLTRLRELAGDHVEGVFGGAGGRYVIDELRRGALGTMPACEITELHVRMLQSFGEGDEPGARDLFERTLPLLSMQAVFRWRLTKAVLVRRGIIDCDHTRAPGPALDRIDRDELDILLARLSDILPL